MKLFVLGHKFHFESENLSRMFFPNADIKLEYEYYETDEDKIVTQMNKFSDSAELSVYVDISGKKAARERILEEYSDDEAEYLLAVCIFECLSEITGYIPDWGLLTGVRPSKLMNKLISQLGEDKAMEYFQNKLLVNEKKSRLARDVAFAQTDIISKNRADSFSLYISIPFCPSRCSYCSFVSHSITGTNAAKLLVPYLENLKKEIELTAKYASDNALRLESVYFGGGTPGILSAEQSSVLINAVKSCFDMSFCREFTYEAGRADTITYEKLEVLKKLGVDRVSINPQTFNDRVLEVIGRKHTAAQAIDAYKLAREIGFESINMDLIAGLPSDTVDSFKNSVDTAVSLNPENITVHALALKRSSNLVTKENAEISQDMAAAQMIDYSNSVLAENRYIPYYMYRQSRCVGNLENVGWCLPGRECVYNIYMMEEIHTVLAVGAGAVTKLKAPDDNKIERIFNYKYPYEYNTGFETLKERKSRITEFYSTYN